MYRNISRYKLYDKLQIRKDNQNQKRFSWIIENKSSLFSPWHIWQWISIGLVSEPLNANTPHPAIWYQEYRWDIVMNHSDVKSCFLLQAILTFDWYKWSRRGSSGQELHESFFPFGRPIDGKYCKIPGQHVQCIAYKNTAEMVHYALRINGQCQSMRPFEMGSDFMRVQAMTRQ